MTTIGILGAGQLGRMLALAGYPLGLRFRFLDPAVEAPAEQLAERVSGSYEDLESMIQFAQGLDLVTFEFENVPVSTTQYLARRVPVFPPPAALESAQDRIAEKNYFRSVGIPTAPFAAVDSREQLDSAIKKIGFPALLKTRRFGYDGKGQVILREADDPTHAWDKLGGAPLILEGWVPFERELSLLMVRSRSGEEAFYPLVENHHREGMLRLSLVPAPGLTDELQEEAEELGRGLLRKSDYVGVLALELFQVASKRKKGHLVANEMAPRVHNSGHWSIEGSITSQFENHLRAILDWPLGSTAVPRPVAMVNLIGTMPSTSELLRFPDLHLHDYSKSPRAGRKLGHLTLLAEDEASLRKRLEELRPVLSENRDFGPFES